VSLSTMSNPSGAPITAFSTKGVARISAGHRINPYCKKRKHPADSSVGRVESNDASVTNATRDAPSAALPTPPVNSSGTRIISDLVVSAVDKAGMEGIDREAIDAIIMKESGNSLFMQQQQKRDDKVNVRIEALRKKLEIQMEKNKNDNGTWLKTLEKQIDNDMSEFLSARPLRSCKVVVDMDMFYMACELLSRPDITDTTPACVGGPSMITTSNYAARRYGVRAAMPGYIGAALVNQLSKGREKLIFCPMNMDLYKEKSLLVRYVLNEYDANLTAYSLDEAYLDLAPYLLCSLVNETWTHEQISNHLLSKDDEALAADINRSGPNVNSEFGEKDENSLDACYDRLLQFSPTECLFRAEAIVSDMRSRVRTITGGLTCSAGLAPNFMLAKIASDMNKPNGQLLIPNDHESIIRFLHPLSTRKVSGIGRVTEKILRAFGITTVQQLYAERALVRFLFDRNPSTCRFLISASYGCSSSTTSDEKDSDESNQQKGISRERTIPSGKTWAEVTAKLEDVARLLSEDMGKKQLSARTIYVKVKLHTFDLLSHGRTLPDGTFVHSAKDLTRIATALFHEIRQKEVDSKGAKAGKSSNTSNTDRGLFSVRLVGIRCTNFKTESSLEHGEFRGTQKTIDQFVAKHSKIDTTPDCRLIPPQHSVNSLPNERNPYSPYQKSNLYSRSHHHHAFFSLDQPVTGSKNETNNVSKVRVPENAGTQGNCEALLHPDIIETPTVRDLRSPDVEKMDVNAGCLECPICHKRIKSSTGGTDDERSYNEVFNHHIDTCLNRPAIQQVVRNFSATDSSKQMRLSFGQTASANQIHKNQSFGVRSSTAKGKIF
jgi:DNA polymerase kappa